MCTVDQSGREFTLFSAEGIALHDSGQSYLVAENNIEGIWVAEFDGGCVAIVLGCEGGIRKRIGYCGAYTVWWSTRAIGKEGQYAYS